MITNFRDLRNVTGQDIESIAYDTLSDTHALTSQTVATLYRHMLQDFGLTEDDIASDWDLYEDVVRSLRNNCTDDSARRYFNRIINANDLPADDYDEHQYDSWKDSFLED